MADSVVVSESTPNKKRLLVYDVTIDGKTKTLATWQVLVFPALTASLNNWTSPIAQHRETIGASMAVKDFGSKTFGQGTNPAGVLSGIKFPNEVSEKSLREKFSDSYAGLNNAHRLMLLEEGAKFERIGLPPEDAQYLETRRFDISEIARIFSVPLHLLQEVTGSTSWGSGIEELNIGFVSYTLQPYAVLWEQEISKKLLNSGDDLYSEFLFEALLRGKLSERTEAYAKARQWGWLSANDIRYIENLNPIKDGDEYLVPLNMIPAGQPREQVETNGDKTK